MNPNPNALHPGAERRLDALHRRFRALWPVPLWRRARTWLAPVLLGPALGVGGLYFYDLSLRFGSAGLVLRHLASAPNCAATMAQQLAPARAGGPGYYRRQDLNGDGLACNTLAERFGSADLATRHLASAANCNAVRAQDLAPAIRGGPGYYAKHDNDNDGIACEVYSGW